ncbi:heat shock protein HSP20 family protein [Ceratobasidium sp. AG-Ba]|nr:heat shock protein HSP20 family protein [Ceratobasidium sp. AG-Ba]QRW03630.1 heat shock protein HSP20 family protein [Ceratobasidium sp. AG-Ba]
MATQTSSTSSKINAFASFKWDTFDKMFDEAFTPRGSVGSLSDTRGHSPEPSRRSHTRSRSAAPTTESTPVPAEEGEFDRLWNDARRVRRTTTTRKRIVQRADSADTDPDVDEMGKLRRPKSRRSDFTETEHNGIVTLVFDLPGIPKSDVKVKFSTQKITVAWQKTTVEEKSEGERLIRERIEKKFLRTIPIPAAVPFDTVRAVLQDEKLTITYPRVEILV